jgi:hypothetical protein
MKTTLRIGWAAALLATLCGCSTLYYGTLEKFGQEKRDILVKRVGKARDAQQETQTTFKDALEQFGATVAYAGGDLQKQYDQLSAELARCESRAADVHARIADVERVARDLFREWAAETKQYQNAQYRRDSEAKLRDTSATATAGWTPCARRIQDRTRVGRVSRPGALSQAQSQREGLGGAPGRVGPHRNGRERPDPGPVGVHRRGGSLHPDDGRLSARPRRRGKRTGFRKSRGVGWAHFTRRGSSWN